MWVYFWILCSVPLFSLSILPLIPVYLNSCSFKIILEILELCSSSLSILFLSGPLSFHIHFKISFSISTTKKTPGIFFGFRCVCRSFWGRMHALTTLNLAIQERGLSFHSLSSYLISLGNVYSFQ